MEDQKIIDLYTNREERAIHETDKKYGRLCTSISMGILNDIRDSEECVSDTWLTLWNQIPPITTGPNAGVSSDNNAKTPGSISGCFWYYRYATVADKGFLEPWFASGPAPSAA